MITTKEVQKMMSADPKMKLDMKIKLDVECIQDDSDMGTADALRHIQRKVKVCHFLLLESSLDSSKTQAALSCVSSQRSGLLEGTSSVANAPICPLLLTLPELHDYHCWLTEPPVPSLPSFDSV